MLAADDCIERLGDGSFCFFPAMLFSGRKRLAGQSKAKQKPVEPIIKQLGRQRSVFLTGGLLARKIYAAAPLTFFSPADVAGGGGEGNTLPFYS